MLNEEVGLKHVTLPILSVLMILGNGMLISVIVRHKNLRTVTNLFVLSLALSDLLLGALIVPLMVLAEEGLLGHSPRTCLAVFSVGIAQVLVSCLTLMVIALERYVAIITPLKHHTFLTIRTAFFIMVGVWMYSILVGALPLLGWNSLKHGMFSTASTQVDLVQHNGSLHRNSLRNEGFPLESPKLALNANHCDPAFTVANQSAGVDAVTDATFKCRYQLVVPGSFVAFMYPGHFVPLWLMMFVLYGQIYMRSRNQSPNSNVRRLSQSLRGHRRISTWRVKENWRALRILAAIVGYFLFSWLPVVVWYGLVFNGFSQETALEGEPGLPYWFYNIGITLAFGNSAVNPFIYGLGNRSVRRAWVQSCPLLKACCCCLARPETEVDKVEASARDEPVMCMEEGVNVALTS